MKKEIKKWARFAKRNGVALALWCAITIAWFGSLIGICHFVWNSAIKSDNIKVAAETIGYLPGDDLIRAGALNGMLIFTAIVLFAYFMETVKNHQKGE